MIIKNCIAQLAYNSISFFISNLRYLMTSHSLIHWDAIGHISLLFICICILHSLILYPKQLCFQQKTSKSYRFVKSIPRSLGQYIVIAVIAAIDSNIQLYMR